MNGTPTARFDHYRLAREAGVMVAIALVLAIVGPFGSFAQPLWVRFVEWLIFAIGGYAFFRPVIAAGDALAAAAGLPRGLAIGVACALASFPTTVLVGVTLAGWRFAAIGLGSLVALYPQVLLIGAIATAVQFLLAARGGAIDEAAPIVIADPPAQAPVTMPEPEPPAPTPPKAGAAFLARLPPAIGRDLLCVENEDHYVRAHTALGSGLILLRLRDAAAELADMDGARVHRGWWVARAAVAEVVRRDRAIAFRLVNGLEVPVARNEVPALRAAGWL